ncbi:hypothetical protein OOK60_13305 [Trichothermofontia sichuanensis B231]|uniref:hypothetical protein n=1 Tax=Trichothermofontia sichuanensis TaxID=3045816 RepID=UPI0022464793|nr:hypothetical protein [Trichothermofontia sichuanensis]UZQ53472.1 hypothetical protein OOK60_13305 [Trichothermofontia sichuanensis B231]
MSVERWTDERLDQLAQLVESNSRTIQTLANLAAEDRQERTAILQSIRVMQQQVHELQQEVRGLNRKSVACRLRTDASWISSSTIASLTILITPAHKGFSGPNVVIDRLAKAQTGVR